MRPARQRPNEPAMISMARGNEVSTKHDHEKSFNPGASTPAPELVIEVARAAPIATSKSRAAPSAALDAVAAAPQPSLPASAKVVRNAAANHIRLRIAKPATAAAARMRPRWPP